MKRRPAWLYAASVFLLALAVRVAYNITVARDYTPLHDSLSYQNIGIDLLTEGCYCAYPHIPTVYRAPFWPAILALIYGLPGPHSAMARFFLAFVGSGTCLLIYYFARDLFGARLGLLAGLAAAVYPELYVYDGWLYSESLYIFLLLAFCYALYRLQCRLHKLHSLRQNICLCMLCGALLGIVSLTRPNGLLVLCLLVPWACILAWTKTLSWRPALIHAGMIMLLAAAIVAPWTIRNYAVTHAFIPVATGDGTVLLGAYNDQVLVRPDYLGTWVAPSQAVPQLAHRFPDVCSATCEVAREDAFKHDAALWVQQHLQEMPRLLALHFINLWQPATVEADLPVDRFIALPAAKFVLLMQQTFPLPIFVLALLGLIVMHKRWRELLFIYFMILQTIAQSLYFYGIPRFRAPIEPMLLLLAAGAVWWFVERRALKHVP